MGNTPSASTKRHAGTRMRRNVVCSGSSVGFQAYFVTSNALVSVGNNSRGQRGNAAKASDHFNVVPGPSWADPECVLATCGRYHALCYDGKDLWVWGDASQGQCGPVADTAVVREPIRVSPFSGLEVKAIACGGEHTLLLVGEQVWAFGANSNGQCGTMGPKSDPNPIPTLADCRMYHIACGVDTSYMCGFDTAGKRRVWSCGRSGNYRLGYDSGASVYQPRPIAELQDVHVELLHGGMSHCMCVSANGEVWAWGNRDSHRCGIPDGKAGPPAEVTWLCNKSIRALCGGQEFCVALLDDEVWVWGKNDYGQLSVAGNQSAPVQLHRFKGQNVTGISCGGWHTLIMVENPGEEQQVFTFGCTAQRRLGRSGNSRDIAPMDSLRGIAEDPYIHRLFGNSTHALVDMLWTKANHLLCSAPIQQLAMHLLCARKFRPECPFFAMPRDIVYIIIQYVSTRNPPPPSP